MDEINAFFDMTKDFVRETVPRGCVSGSLAANIIPKPMKAVKREYKDPSYPESALEEQHRQMLEFELSDEVEAPHTSRHGVSHRSGGATSSCMDELEGLSDEDDDDDDVKPKAKRIDDGVYRKYTFDLRRDTTLPIHDSKVEILTQIRKNPVTILEGDTGCGKTTQVSQYILDEAYQRDEYCKIVCTQPRRIAAYSIADRVSKERGWENGTVVGYKVGLHTNMSDDTRILYCTTGVLLQNLIKEKSLQAYTHILLDEVHERDQDMDFLLIVIRKLLVTNSRHVKIVLMSATINTVQFADYFKIRNNPAPVLRVDTRRHYRVDEFFFESLNPINKQGVEINYQEPGISAEVYHLTLKLIIVIDTIEKQEVAANAAVGGPPPRSASILIFLPGINEIDLMHHELLKLKDNADTETTVKLMPLRLHSMIPPEDQHKVFIPSLPGYRKVILATNIAESSITVPDVKYVIDFCLTKLLIADSRTAFTRLKLHWASRANCRQRAGRAGRVMNGRVYRMVDKYFYENCMSEYSQPEMERCPLETVVLKAKLLDLDTPSKILALAMSPPAMNDILNTILTLKEVGALYCTTDGLYVEDDGDLTFLGRVMAALPLDIRLTRLIMIGYMFSCLEDVIIIAAGLSVRSIFKFHMENCTREIECHIQKLRWADGSSSDLLALLRAYRIWTSMRETNTVRDGESERRWAKHFLINLRSLKEMHLLVLELKERLLVFGIDIQTSMKRVLWIDRERTVVLKVIIAGAFYPNYFTRTNLTNYERERSIYHTLCGHDPCSTVYFTNFKTRHIGQLYTRSIKGLFHIVHIAPKNMDVHFQMGSERVFITFKGDPADEGDEQEGRLAPGHVRAELYRALRMRMLRIPTTFKVMEPNQAIKYAISHGIGEMHEGIWQPVKRVMKHAELVVLPSVFQKTIRGYITHIDHCSKFYFQPLAEMERMREIRELLNHPDAIEQCRFRNASEIAKGMIMAAPSNGEYGRVKVLKVITAVRQHVQFKVLFIDYGNTAIIDFDKMRCYSPNAQATLADMPPRLFACRLAMTSPSLVRSPHGLWLEEANEQMRQIANEGKVEIEIFSVVEGIANVFIRVGNSTLNKLLVERRLARNCDENYLSKTDHDFRQRKQSVSQRFLDEDHSKQNEEYLRSVQQEIDADVEPPPPELCMRAMNLNGPFSPLETKIYAAAKAGAWKCVTVERESVNAIMLDTDPNDLHERLVVAATVSESQRGDTLMARSTTLMPNISGFGALMTLLFCPTMQIKTNLSQTKYATILAGLGYDRESMAPLYEAHDILLNLDVNLLQSDLELINELRYRMDSILFTTNSDEERPRLSDIERGKMMVLIKDVLIRLLNKDRKYMEIQLDVRDQVWEQEPETVKQAYDHRAIFPFHSAPQLYDEKFDRIHALATHCSELHKMRKFNYPIDPVKCLLCNHTLDNIISLRIHLLSQLHRDREHQIRFTPAQ